MKNDKYIEGKDFLRDGRAVYYVKNPDTNEITYGESLEDAISIQKMKDITVQRLKAESEKPLDAEEIYELQEWLKKNAEELYYRLKRGEIIRDSSYGDILGKRALKNHYALVIEAINNITNRPLKIDIANNGNRYVLYNTSKVSLIEIENELRNIGL